MLKYCNIFSSFNYVKWLLYLLSYRHCSASASILVASKPFAGIRRTLPVDYYLIRSFGNSTSTNRTTKQKGIYLWLFWCRLSSRRPRTLRWGIFMIVHYTTAHWPNEPANVFFVAVCTLLQSMLIDYRFGAIKFLF